MVATNNMMQCLTLVEVVRGKKTRGSATPPPTRTTWVLRLVRGVRGVRVARGAKMVRVSEESGDPPGLAATPSLVPGQVTR